MPTSSCLQVAPRVQKASSGSQSEAHQVPQRLTPRTIGPRDLPLPPEPTSTAPGAAPQAAAFPYGGRLVSPAVTQEVAPCPRLPPCPSTLPVRKNGGWAWVATNGRRGMLG